MKRWGCRWSSSLSIAAFSKGTSDLQTGALTVSGWVRSVRVHKSVSFVSINDGSSHDSLQVVLPTPLVKQLVPRGLNTGASVRCTGHRSVAKNGKVDMTADTIDMIGDAMDFPLQKKEHTAEFLRENLHLRARTDRFGTTMRVRSACGAALRKALDSQGFYWISTPILTGNDCEGAGELFRVAQAQGKTDFFGTKDVYLTVSGQLHSEMFVHGLSKVYTFGPTFRAENSNTTRHLAEFWMLEPELAFCSAVEASDLAESCIKTAVGEVLERCGPDIEFLQTMEGTHRGKDSGGLSGRLQRCIQAPFVRMTYLEASAIVKRKSSLPLEDREPLSSAHERFIVEDHCGGTPVIVSNYPREIKPFYALAHDDADDTSACFDLLVSGIGELVGGSAREHRFDRLESRMQKDNLLPSLQWYLDLRKYGTVPHAGWGMGFDRFVQYLTGSDNIRDVSPVPRFPGSIIY